jgi:hypothetical protein
VEPDVTDAPSGAPSGADVLAVVTAFYRDRRIGEEDRRRVSALLLETISEHMLRELPKGTEDGATEDGAT